ADRAARAAASGSARAATPPAIRTQRARRRPPHPAERRFVSRKMRCSSGPAPARPPRASRPRPEASLRAARKPYPFLLDLHSGLGAAVGREEKQSRPFTGSGQNHPFGHTEFHLARRNIRQHHRELAFILLTIVDSITSTD